MTTPRWLHGLFFGALAVILVVVGGTMARELRRPVTVEQRVLATLDVVDRCESCHDAATHPGAWLDTHPVERFACTPCHGGQGLALTRVAAHEAAPDWERPLYTAADREAACGACHEANHVEGAPVLSRGRTVLAERGCTGCHDVPGIPTPLDSGTTAYAPALDGLRDKTTAGWVRAWLQDPAALNQDHRMPVFDLPAADREALVAFLWSLPGPSLEPLPTDPAGDSDRGRLAVATRRCATCHRINDRGGGHAPDLGQAGAKLVPAWMYTLLRDTHRLRPTTRMPGFLLDPAEAADIVAYAREQWIPDTAEPSWAPLEGPVDPALAVRGRTLFLELGCAGCHGAGGVTPTRVAMALDRLGSRHLADLPTNNTNIRDLPHWISAKILVPRIWDTPGGAVSRMPAYTGLSTEDALAAGVALASLRARPPAGEYVVHATPPALPGGEVGRLVERFRCLVCHRVGGAVGVGSGVSGAGGDISRVPLDGEGARVRQAWLQTFLVSPVTLRTNQPERMPVLGLTPDDAARLAAWIDTSLGDDRVPVGAPLGDPIAGRAAFTHLGCPACHVAEGKGEMGGPVLDGARDRLNPDWVVAMLRQGPALVPGGRHPVETHSEKDAADLAAYVCGLGPP